MYPRILYPLLAYRSLVFPFLVLCAITVPCWLVLRLYVLRARARRVSIRRESLVLVAVVYLSGVAAATLTPAHTSRAVAESSAEVDLRPSLASLACSSPTLPRGSSARSFCVRNARGNVVLFVPLGILIPLLWRRIRFATAMPVAIAVSIGIELAQYLSRAWAHRTADVNDVILNSLGACLGLVVVYLVQWTRGRGHSRSRLATAVPASGED